MKARLSILAVLVVCALAAPARAFDGQFVLIEGGQWDVSAGPVEYVLEPNGSDDLTDQSDLDAVRAAFRGWECVPGVTLRFLELQEPGPADLNLDDGKNTVFWDETGAFGLGPGTLGVTLGDNANPRNAADIVFNGSDATWSTDDGPSAVDIGAIAVHEIGHFIGLDHPCDFGGGQETNCNGPERSVMTPAWGGELDRLPLPDDEAGARALYPADDPDATCDGPKLQGQACDCNDECADDLACVEAPGFARVCASRCAADNDICGSRFVCALSAPAGDEAAPGVCVPRENGTAPAGSICTAGNQCASGTCALLFELTRSLCQVPCESTSDCGGDGTCFRGFCLGAASGVQCEDDEEPEPECACASTSSPAPLALVGLAWLAWRVGRPRRRGRRR